jgi:hypothetical protein
MSAGQIALPNRSISVPFAALAVAVAFAIGTLAGLGLPRVVDSASQGTDATGSAAAVRAVQAGVAENSMSDAAYPFLNGAGQAGSQAGVAENNMSDAAYPFLNGSAVK